MGRAKFVAALIIITSVTTDAAVADEQLDGEKCTALSRQAVDLVNHNHREQAKKLEPKLLACHSMLKATLDRQVKDLLDATHR